MPTAIEWTDETWNPVRARLLAEPAKVGWHCEHKSPGCANCYAEGLNEKRFGTGLPYKPGHRKDVETFVDDKAVVKPLHWRRSRKVFVCSMTDLFADFVTDEMIDRVFAVMALCPQHIFQVLTKRADRMRAYLTGHVPPRIWRAARVLGLPDRAYLPITAASRSAIMPLPNVWLGVSVEDQQRADERIPDLLATPAAVHFLSCEPLLGPVDLTRVRRFGPTSREYINATGGRMWTDQTGVPNPDPAWAYPGMPFTGDDARGLDWVICGGESGPGARPMHPDWARSLRDQCAAAGVPFFFKQWGQFRPYDGETDDYTCNDPTGEYGRPSADARHVLNDGEQPGPSNIVIPVGKKAAGRLLDGVEHDGMPA